MNECNEKAFEQHINKSVRSEIVTIKFACVTTFLDPEMLANKND